MNDGVFGLVIVAGIDSLKENKTNAVVYSGREIFLNNWPEIGQWKRIRANMSGWELEP